MSGVQVGLVTTECLWQWCGQGQRRKKGDQYQEAGKKRSLSPFVSPAQGKDHRIVVGGVSFIVVPVLMVALLVLSVIDA